MDERDPYIEAALGFFKHKKPDKRLGEVRGSSMELKPYDAGVVENIRHEREQQRPRTIFSALKRAS